MRLLWRIIVFLAITIIVVYIAVFVRLSEIVLYKSRSFRESVGGLMDRDDILHAYSWANSGCRVSWCLRNKCGLSMDRIVEKVKSLIP